VAQILIASPLADFAALAVESVDGCRAIKATNTIELERALTSNSRERLDLAVVDLSWHSLGLQWRFDGLDVLQALTVHGVEIPVLLAAQGHGTEVDYLQEAAAHPLFSGVVLKSEGARALISAIRAVLDRRERPVPDVFHPVLPADGTYTVHEFLRERVMARHVAFAIATGRTSTWSDIAGCILSLTGKRYDADSLAKHASEQFRDAFSRLYTAPRTPNHTRASVIYFWCGERRNYLLSWGRRHHSWHLSKPTADRFPFFP
jgi:hypothetical protein